MHLFSTILYVRDFKDATHSERTIYSEISLKIMKCLHVEDCPKLCGKTGTVRFTVFLCSADFSDQKHTP